MPAAERRRRARALGRLRQRLGRGAGLPAADLRGADLRGEDLSAADLRWADLRDADLRGCRLHGTRLRAARLDGADLRGVVAADLDLEDASLHGADLAEAWLDGAILLSADLSGARLYGAWLRRVDLRHARLADADLRRADLSRADLTDALLLGAQLDGARWARACLSHSSGLTDAQRQDLLDAGAWQGAIAPELAPIVALAARLARPAAHWATGRALRLRGSTRRWLSDRAEARSARASSRQHRAEEARARRLDSLPGGPGADLSGQDLHGQDLHEVDWTGAVLSGCRLDGAQLQRAVLDGADASDASMRGVRLAHAHLRGLRAPGARLVDADLRDADLRDADLSGADLTGADLRGARLHGARLQGADLTAARLAEQDLEETDLREAILDQADLAGASMDETLVGGADLRGALGLAPATRSALAERGARTAEASIDALVKGVDPRHVWAALAVLGLGVGTYTATRFMAGRSASDPVMIAADEIRSLPPAEALARFEDLADDAALPADKVGYLLEAAGQARILGDDDAEQRLLRAALAATGEDVEMGAEVRLMLASTLAEADQGSEALALLDPLLDLARQSTEQRARAMLLYEELATASGTDPSARLAAVFDTLGELPDAAAELYLSLSAERANDGDLDGALADLDAAADLPITEGTVLRVMEARARTLDRAGELDAAADRWIALMDASDADSVPHQAAMLALADLRQRQGRADEARVLLQPILEASKDKQLKARARLVEARLSEGEGDVAAAAQAYRAAIELAATDPETAEEARLSLARVLGQSDPALLDAVLGDLDDEARAMVQVQARLGEAREALESGRAADARAIYAALVEDKSLDPMTMRDARTGLGEAMAQEGELAEALVVWRDLLGETARPEDRVHLELRIAQGLVRGGRLDEAEEAYAALENSNDPDIAVQGRLGLAQVALALGRREEARSRLQQVADEARDPAWKVQALEELADMAMQEGDADAALAGWRAVLGAVPPGHAAASRARLAVVTTLAAANRIGEALDACDAAIAGAQAPAERFSARIACAEVQERAGDVDKAHDGFVAILADLEQGAQGVADELPADAAEGAARTAQALGRPQDALAAAEQGLGLVTDDRVRVSLLGIKTSALTALGRNAEAAAARAERDSIVDAAPEAAAGMLVEAAQEARTRGEFDEALALMTQALDAQSDPGPRAGILVELGDMHLEAEQLAEAGDAYDRAIGERPDDAMVGFQAGMGLAEVARRSGDPARAATLLAALQPPDATTRRWQAEARARALVEAGDPAAGDAWDALAALAEGDADVIATAARGKADALFAADRYEDALPLYVQAADSAPDPVHGGWSRLGQAAALAALDRTDEAAAVLDSLRGHSDPEVALQAAIQRSQLAASAEDWDAAVAAVQGLDAADLGSAWDASLSQARAAAQSGQGDLDGADETLQALAERWPGDEEALVPSLLGRAELARQQGDEASARSLAEQARAATADPGFQDQADRFLASLTVEP